MDTTNVTGQGDSHGTSPYLTPIAVLLGAVIIAFAENFAVWQFSGAWRDLAAFVVLIVFLLIRPRGIITE